MRSLLDEPRLVVDGAPGSRRRWRRPRIPIRRRTLAILLIISLVLVGVMTWLFLFSSAFTLRQVVVEGVRAVSPADVVRRTELTSGEPLARISTAIVAERVRSIPSVARVSVRRDWPDTVVIEIVERNRLAVVKQGNQFGVLDVDGTVFETSKKRPVGLPTMTGEPGPGRLAALEVLQQLPPDVLARVESVSADGPEAVVLTMEGGVKVMWGSPVDSPLKADVLRLLLQRLGGAKWIDVRVPSNPSTANASPTPAPPPVTESPSPPVDPDGTAATGGAIAPGLPTAVTPTATPTAGSGASPRA